MRRKEVYKLEFHKGLQLLLVRYTSDLEHPKKVNFFYLLYEKKKSPCLLSDTTRKEINFCPIEYELQDHCDCHCIRSFRTERCNLYKLPYRQSLFSIDRATSVVRDI